MHLSPQHGAEEELNMTDMQTLVKLKDTIARLGGFSGDGGAAQDDSVKASLDLAHTDLDAIIADTTTLLQKATKAITLSTAAVPVTETLFTVTGEVECYVVGYIDTAVTGATLTLEVGIAGATTGIIAQTAVADLLIDLLWMDATPAILISKPSEKIIANGADIIHTIRTAAATAGAITYYCWWRPLSSDGNVVAA